MLLQPDSLEINWFRQFCQEVDKKEKGKCQAENGAQKSVLSTVVIILITPILKKLNVWQLYARLR